MDLLQTQFHLSWGDQRIFHSLCTHDRRLVRGNQHCVGSGNYRIADRVNWLRILWLRNGLDCRVQWRGCCMDADYSEFFLLLGLGDSTGVGTLGHRRAWVDGGLYCYDRIVFYACSRERSIIQAGFVEAGHSIGLWFDARVT